MAKASFKNPIPTNAIIGDVDNIRELFTVLAKANPALADDVPEGAYRLIEVAPESAKRDANGLTLRLERYDNGAWVKIGSLDISVGAVGGYGVSATAKPNTIPIYNSDGALVGNITGNAATAGKWATPISIQVGGIASSTAQMMDGTSPITIPINSITLNNAADTAVNGTLSPAHGGTGRTDGAALDIVVPSLAGDVSAKAYGQIGYHRIVNPSSTSADSLIVEGEYAVSAVLTITDYDKNKWPTNYGWDNFLKVGAISTGRLIQLLQGATINTGAWKRSSDNKGASWSGWVPFASQSRFTQIYISKSGNDLNMGVSSSYPVLTIARAFQIADGLAQQGSGQPYIYFNIGEGSWGNIVVRHVYYLVIFRPYDGATATAYSTSLPVFGTLTIVSSYFWFQTCVSGVIAAQYNSMVLVAQGYKRVAALQATYFGQIVVASQNAATNLIDFTGGGNIPLYMAYGGRIFMQYVHLRLCGNLTTNFVNIFMHGMLSVHNGQTVYDSTSFTNSSKKYTLQYGAFFNSGEANGGVVWLNALPGASAGTYDTTCFLNGITSALVKKTGDTMSGELGIVRNGRALMLRDTGLNRNAAPSANLYRRELEMYDNQNAAMGAIQAAFQTTQRFHMGLFAQRTISGVIKYAEIGGWIQSDGTVGGYAPNPASTSNTNDIATTAWVRSRISASVPSVNNTTLTGVTLNSSYINYSTTKLTGTPPFTDNDDKIANLYWVNNMCGRLFYGMCPEPTLDTATYRYNTWYSAPCNGYFLGSFIGMAYQEWNIGTSTTSYNGSNAGTVDSAFTYPVQYRSYFRLRDDAATSSSRLGWTRAMAQHGWNGSRPTSRDTQEEPVMPGMGYIYLRVVGEEVLAFGDLVALADNCGFEVPNERNLEYHTEQLEEFYKNGMRKIQEDYDKAIVSIEIEREEKIEIASLEITRIYESLQRTNPINEDDPDEIPYAVRLDMQISDAVNEISAQIGTRLVEVDEARQKAYTAFQDEFQEYQKTVEAEWQSQIAEMRKECERIFTKAAEMADLTIPASLWSENRCNAHLEDGKIVLGPTREALISLLDREIEKRLKVYDAEILKLTRQKRFATIAETYKSGKGAHIISRFANASEAIDAKIFEWDLYAAGLATMSDLKGYPWDGGLKHTPWPESPLDRAQQEEVILG